MIRAVIALPIMRDHTVSPVVGVPAVSPPLTRNKFLDKYCVSVPQGAYCLLRSTAHSTSIQRDARVLCGTTDVQTVFGLDTLEGAGPQPTPPPPPSSTFRCWRVGGERHIPPHSAQPQHTNDWAPRTFPGSASFTDGPINDRFRSPDGVDVDLAGRNLRVLCLRHLRGVVDTGPDCRLPVLSRSTGRSGRKKAATQRNMRREERVTVQGPVKEQQPDGMSHGGGGVNGLWGDGGPQEAGAVPMVCGAVGGRGEGGGLCHDRWRGAVQRVQCAAPCGGTYVRGHGGWHGRGTDAMVTGHCPGGGCGAVGGGGGGRCPIPQNDVPKGVPRKWSSEGPLRHLPCPRRRGLAQCLASQGPTSRTTCGTRCTRRSAPPRSSSTSPAGACGPG